MTLREHTDRTRASTQLSSEFLSDASDLFNKKFEQLRQIYRVDLCAKLDLITNDWNELQQGWNQTLVERLYRQVHNLAGSGATFGFSTLSETAHEFSLLLKPALSIDMPFDNTMRRKANTFLWHMRTAACCEDRSIR